jgi:hypothetical protein
LGLDTPRASPTRHSTIFLDPAIFLYHANSAWLRFIDSVSFSPAAAGRRLQDGGCRTADRRMTTEPSGAGARGRRRPHHAIVFQWRRRRSPRRVHARSLHASSPWCNGAAERRAADDEPGAPHGPTTGTPAQRGPPATPGIPPPDAARTPKPVQAACRAGAALRVPAPGWLLVARASPTSSSLDGFGADRSIVPALSLRPTRPVRSRRPARWEPGAQRSSWSWPSRHRAKTLLAPRRADYRAPSASRRS